MEYIIKKIDDISENDINNFYNKLYKYKKYKVNKYKNKKASIIGDILLNDLLIEHSISYNDLTFKINKYGKPYIEPNKIYFNISHSHEYVITIISNKEIGIDIEKIRKTPLKVINQFATENEKKYILSSNKDIYERIFKIYTLKEAYFKMKGTNLNGIFNVEFIINNDKVICSDKNVNIGFICFDNKYVISYCERL